MAALMLAALGAACGRSLPPPPPPTEAEARAYLDQLVGLITAGDLERFCEVAGGGCDGELRNAEAARVPTEPPRITGTRAIQPRRIDATSWDRGGRVLELCGRDGLGEPYVAELLVFREGDRLRAIAAPYWLGIRIADGPIAGGEPKTAPACR